jgi:hypothetical protein
VKQNKAAKEWRLRNGLTHDQLSDLTGYSVIAIKKFETGMRHKANGEQHSEWVWQRYRVACSGAERQIKSGRAFEW